MTGSGSNSLHAGTVVPDPRTPVKTAGVPRPPALKALTSVRFFAALHVALYHLVRPFSLWGFLAPAMRNGYSGVSFFFVLSGFILTYAHAQEYEQGLGNKGRFWMARFARIYPVYALSLVFAALEGVKALHVKAHWIALAADFLMLQSWSMRMVNFFNSGAWTLSCEAFFYLLFPFLLLPLRPRTRTAAIVWTTAFFLLSIAAPLYLLHRFPAATFTENFDKLPGQDVDFLVSRSPLFAVPQFFTGMALGWLYVRFRPTERAMAVMATAGVLLFSAMMLGADHLPYLPLHNGLLIPAYVLLLLGLCGRNWLSRALSPSWLVLLGEASFAFYLYHILLIQFTERWDVQHTFTAMWWRLAIAIPLSVLIHLYIERPCRRRIMLWWGQRHGRTVGNAAA